MLESLPREQASPYPQQGRYWLEGLPSPSWDTFSGWVYPGVLWTGPRAGAAPAGHGRQREHHLNEALRHCCRCPRDVTAEILLVSRFGPPSLAACEEEALLAWPLPGSPPPMLGSLPEPCRLHLPAPYGAGAAGRTRLRCNAQSTRKSQISHPRGRCGNNGHEKSGLTERVGVVGAGTPLWLLG